MRLKPTETWDEYKESISKAFENYKCPAVVEDVFAVPDYASFFEPSIDRNLSNYAKEEETQHQWRFESVTPSGDFPLGAKVTYRSYSSNKVVEFKKLPKDMCVSPIGQLTGLEAYTTFCTWQPAVNRGQDAYMGKLIICFAQSVVLFSPYFSLPPFFQSRGYTC